MKTSDKWDSYVLNWNLFASKNAKFKNDLLRGDELFRQVAVKLGRFDVLKPAGQVDLLTLLVLVAPNATIVFVTTGPQARGAIVPIQLRAAGLGIEPEVEAVPHALGEPVDRVGVMLVASADVVQAAEFDPHPVVTSFLANHGCRHVQVVESYHPVRLKPGLKTIVPPAK